MYILALDFFEKYDKYVSKARSSFVCREFLAFKYVFIVFFLKINQMIIYICMSEILKTCI